MIRRPTAAIAGLWNLPLPSLAHQRRIDPHTAVHASPAPAGRGCLDPDCRAVLVAVVVEPAPSRRLPTARFLRAGAFIAQRVTCRTFQATARDIRPPRCDACTACHPPTGLDCTPLGPSSRVQPARLSERCSRIRPLLPAMRAPRRPGRRRRYSRRHLRRHNCGRHHCRRHRRPFATARRHATPTSQRQACGRCRPGAATSASTSSLPWLCW